MPEHYKIASQTVKRVNESGGFIFFEKEMAKPCKAVSANRNNNEPKPFTGYDSQNDTNKYQERSREM